MCSVIFNEWSYQGILGTKKVYFKGVLEELLWFLKGSTNAKELQEKKVHIWDGNSTREYLDANGFKNYEVNELGPIYGWQWRNFGKKYKVHLPKKYSNKPVDAVVVPIPFTRSFNANTREAEVLATLNK